MAMPRRCGGDEGDGGAKFIWSNYGGELGLSPNTATGLNHLAGGIRPRQHLPQTGLTCPKSSSQAECGPPIDSKWALARLKNLLLVARKLSISSDKLHDHRRFWPFGRCWSLGVVTLCDLAYSERSLETPGLGHMQDSWMRFSTTSPASL